MSNGNIVDQNVIDLIVSNQSMFLTKVKSELSKSGKHVSDIETAFVYWNVSKRVKEKLGVLY